MDGAEYCWQLEATVSISEAPGEMAAVREAAVRVSAPLGTAMDGVAQSTAPSSDGTVATSPEPLAFQRVILTLPAAAYSAETTIGSPAAGRSLQQ